MDEMSIIFLMFLFPATVTGSTATAIETAATATSRTATATSRMAGEPR